MEGGSEKKTKGNWNYSYFINVKIATLSPTYISIRLLHESTEESALESFYPETASLFIH